MTDDVEVTIYGFIDRKGKVVAKFKHIHEVWKQLNAMREEAESKTNR